MKRHPRRSDEEWLSIIKECRTSGLPDKTWCLDHGIQPSKFYYHVRRLRAKACEITEHSQNPHPIAQKQEVVQLSFEALQENGVLHSCKDVPHRLLRETVRAADCNDISQSVAYQR